MADTTVQESTILRWIEQLSLDQEVIREKVDRRRKELLKTLSVDQVADALAGHFISNALFKSAASGAATSLPFKFPFIGTVGTIATMVGADLSFILKTQMDLCSAIASAYETSLSEEEIQKRAFILIGLSDFEAMKKSAFKTGVKLSLKKVVEKIAVITAQKGGAYLMCELGSRIAGRISQRSLVSSFLLKPLAYIGVPLGGYLDYRSTKKVAERAKEYFRKEVQSDT